MLFGMDLAIATNNSSVKCLECWSGGQNTITSGKNQGVAKEVDFDHFLHLSGSPHFGEFFDAVVTFLSFFREEQAILHEGITFKT